MRYYTDLHSHSRFARACSANLNLPNLARACVQKGIGIMGTGDFTHPTWFGEIQQQLERSEHQGLYRLKQEHASGPERKVLFMATVEVATFLGTPQGTKKIHHLIFAPSLEAAGQINDALAQRWKKALPVDGRPMLANCSSAELVERVKQASPQAEIVAAHAWTPWFGVFGSKGGYNSIKEAYQDQAPKVLGVETGMSSTPAMNWRIPELDNYTIISGSDLHSPNPWRIGRECCVLEFDSAGLSYPAIMNALRERDKRHFVQTIETDPGYGKYHVDGHRACGVSLAPEQSKELGGQCPQCKRPLTIGVLARIKELAARPEGYQPAHAIPFQSPLPLHELLAAVYRTQVTTRKVAEPYQKLIAHFGNEFAVLLDAPLEQIQQVVHAKVARAILLNRAGQVPVKPGYDGVYGEAYLPDEYSLAPDKAPKTQPKAQTALDEFT